MPTSLKPVAKRRTDWEPRPRSRPRPGLLPVDFPTEPALPLPIPTGELAMSLADVLAHRRSSRALAAPSRAEVAALLWHAARTRGSESRGPHRRWETRAAPSAGGIHPVHLAICRFGTDRRALRYDPVRHALVPLPIPQQQVARFLADVQDVVYGRSTVIALLTDPAATNRWYERGESLVWRDAGCQLMTLQVVATGLGLGSCMLGLEGQLLKLPSKPGIRPFGVILIGRTSSKARTNLRRRDFQE